MQALCAWYFSIIRRFRASAQFFGNGIYNSNSQVLRGLSDTFSGACMSQVIVARSSWSSMNYPKQRALNWSLSHHSISTGESTDTDSLLQRTFSFIESCSHWTLHVKLTRSGILVVTSQLNRAALISALLWRQLICSTIALNGWYATQSTMWI